MTRSIAILGIAAIFAGPVCADHIDEDFVFADYHPCAEDSGGVGSCTANEINIAQTTSIDFIEKPSDCVLGETLFATGITAVYGLNTGVRYDPLLWVGQLSNDPREPDPNLDLEEKVGSCFVTSAPYQDNLIMSLEEDEAADSCHDISNPDTSEETVHYVVDFELECQDVDADNSADAHVLVTWVQNMNLLCGNREGEVFGTGAPPKCDYTLIDLEIPVLTGTLTVAKVTESDAGGTATLDDFDVSVDGMEVEWSDSSSTTGGIELVKISAGTYTLSEADVDGYTEGTWSCVDQDNQDVPVSNGGHFSGADVTVAEGRRVTCSITNSDDEPVLTLIKSVINDDGGDAEPGDFQLRLDGGGYVNAPFTSGDSPPVMAGPAYTLSEDPFDGYTDLGVSCFDEGAEEVVPHPVTLTLGQVVTCTLTNDDEVLPPPPPELTLIKSVTNDDGGDAEPGDFQLRLDGGGYVNAPFTSGDSPLVEAGPAYTLSEDVFPGYADLGVTCFDEDAGEFVPHPVTLAPGQDVTCTIANDDIAPELTLLKYVINDDGGDAEPGDFQLRLNGGDYVNAPFSSGDSPPVAANTPYTLSEDPFPGYNNLGVSCFDEGAGEEVSHPVTLALGQVVTCTLTNDDVIGSQLFLVKSVINDNGGDAGPGDFQLRLDGGDYDNAPFTSGDSPLVEADTPYTLSEDVFPGYENLGVSCFDEDAGVAVPHPVTLDEDQRVTCTIANDDIAPELTLLKSVINDDGGDAEPGDFQLRLDGGDYVNAPFTSGDSPPVDANTAYTLSEDVFPGYLNVGVSCFDEGAEEAVPHPVTLSEGQVVTCTIENDDIQPSLTIVKTILFNEGGPATLGDFDVRVNGVAVPWADPGSTSGGSELVATAAATYTLSEADLEGYDEGTWSCVDDDGEVPVSNDGNFGGSDVTVAPGQDVTCSIINAPSEGESLTVEKIIVSDHGGTATLTEFEVSVDGVEVDWSNPASTTGGKRLVTELAGTYTLSEVAVDGYDPGTWTCSDLDGPVPVTNGGAFDGAVVTVGANQHVLCSITNDDLPPPIEQSLTVTKIIVSDNGGTATVADFEVSVDGVEVEWSNPDSPTGGTEEVRFLPGTYRLSEADVDDYVEGQWTCMDQFGEVPVTNGGLFSGADVVVVPDQRVHCSITNEDEYVPPPGLIVVKVIRSVNGGTATLDDFDVSVDGFEVDWEDPGSLTGGSRFVSGRPGTYALSEADLEGYMEGRWSCRDAKYRLVPLSNDGHFSGADVVVEAGQQVTCTITNNDLKPQPDLNVTKRTDPAIGECGVIIGQSLDFAIEAANAGPGLAEGVILEDHWSWQLKLSRPPDMIECIEPDPEERRIRCKLGNMEPGTSKEVSLGFMIGGNPGEEACNKASVSAYPNDHGDPADNEAEVCFGLVGKLMLETTPGCGELPVAFAGEAYDESIGISGGEGPYEAAFNPSLPDGFAGTVAGDEVRIQGCSTKTGASEFSITLEDKAGCQDTRDAPAVCTLLVVEPPDCPMGELVPSEITPAGAPTPDADVLPDESVQKVVVDPDRNRYLVGFAYRDHDYASDPNGPYVEHPRNYDIRVVKYDDEGSVMWDKTYDTGNDDYGYAIALDPEADQPSLFVGGGVEVETGVHAWHEALLLEIDPATGCPVGKHFQSAGKGTTSAFYDIATDGSKLYAVGERQRNEQLVGQFGALIGIYDHSEFAGPGASCEGDHHVIGYPPPAGPDPALIRTLVREGGFIPTVAYSVQLPDPDCIDCPVLVGGRSEAGGWVDRIETGDLGLEEWLTPGLLGDFSVQDTAVTGDRVIVVGASSQNDMRVLGYDRAGSELWATKDLGKGRLRGVAFDEYEAFYVVGRSDDESSAGLIFKFSASGDEIDRDRLERGTDTTFTDVAIFGPGNGVVAGRNDESRYDYSWFQVDFECDLACRDEGN